MWWSAASARTPAEPETERVVMESAAARTHRGVTSSGTGTLCLLRLGELPRQSRDDPSPLHSTGVAYMIRHRDRAGWV